MGTWTKTIPSSTVPSTFAGFPGDMDDWTCAQWKAYYQNNKIALGKAKALSIIDVDSENVGAFASVHYCQYDCEWIKFFSAEGLEVSNIVSTVYCGANSIVKSTVNTAVNTVDSVSNVTGFVSSITSSKLLIGLGLVVGGVIVYKLVNSDAVKDNLKNLKYLA